jgi:hypothetical protein
MATLINTLENTNINDLLRAVNSTKEYLYFNISVFNSGVSIFIQCTDKFKQPSARSWNGYDFIIENDTTTNYYILESLKAILNDMTIVKTDRQIERIKLILNK